MKELSSAAPVTSASTLAKKSNPDLTLRVVTDTAEFAALEKEWTRLSAGCPDTDIFATWPWLYHWWRVYGQDLDLRLYLVRDAVGRLRGVLPCYLCETRVFKLVHTYELRLVGTGFDTSADYLDVLAAPRDRGAVTSLIIPHLLNEAAVWDVLCMDNMPAESPFTRRLPREMPGHQFVRERRSVPIIELPPTWDDYLLTLSDHRRDQIRLQRRRFQRELAGRHFVWHNRHSLDEAVDRLFSLQRSGLDSTAGAVSPEHLSFHRRLMHELFERDQLRLHCLEADGAIGAMLYCYWWHETLYFFQGGFDPRWEHLQPRSVLLGHAIEHAIGEGAARFDMLKGDLEFKRTLAKQTRETVTLGAYRNSGKGRIARLRREILPALKRTLLAGRRNRAD